MTNWENDGVYVKAHKSYRSSNLGSQFILVYVMENEEIF